VAAVYGAADVGSDCVFELVINAKTLWATNQHE
jgi:hypothetical protein